MKILIGIAFIALSLNLIAVRSDDAKAKRRKFVDPMSSYSSLRNLNYFSKLNPLNTDDVGLSPHFYGHSYQYSVPHHDKHYSQKYAKEEMEVQRQNPTLRSIESNLSDPDSLNREIYNDWASTKTYFPHKGLKRAGKRKYNNLVYSPFWDREHVPTQSLGTEMEPHEINKDGPILHKSENPKFTWDWLSGLKGLGDKKCCKNVCRQAMNEHLAKAKGRQISCSAESMKISHTTTGNLQCHCPKSGNQYLAVDSYCWTPLGCVHVTNPNTCRSTLKRIYNKLEHYLTTHLSTHDAIRLKNHHSNENTNNLKRWPLTKKGSLERIANISRKTGSHGILWEEDA